MSNSADGTACVFYLIYLVIYALAGTIAVQYLLKTFLNKDIDFIGDLVIGILTGSFAIPIAIVIYILECFGVTF